MDYYILLPGDSTSNLSDSNLLGTVGLRHNFWPSSGLVALQKVAEETPEMLEEIRIINGKGTELTIEQFMDMIDTLNIKKR